jgi:hypothetical protein
MAHIAHYLGLLHKAQSDLADAFRQIAESHVDEVDVFQICRRLAAQCDAHAEALAPFLGRYGEEAPEEPDRLHAVIFQGSREGGLGLLRDLQDLYLMAAECAITWTVVGQAAQGVRDTELMRVVQTCEQETEMQLKWIRSRMKEAAPQALVVA